MAVEAVKMGRIPKVEKERALFEAHCAADAEAAGAEEDEDDAMDQGFADGGGHVVGLSRVLGCAGRAEDVLEIEENGSRPICNADSHALETLSESSSSFSSGGPCGMLLVNFKNSDASFCSQEVNGNAPPSFEGMSSNNFSFQTSKNITCGAGQFPRKNTPPINVETLKPHIEPFPSNGNAFCDSPTSTPFCGSKSEPSLQPDGFTTLTTYQGPTSQAAPNGQTSTFLWNGCHPNVGKRSEVSLASLPLSSPPTAGNNSHGVPSFSMTASAPQRYWNHTPQMLPNSDAQYPFSVEIKRESIETQDSSSNLPQSLSNSHGKLSNPQCKQSYQHISPDRAQQFSPVHSSTVVPGHPLPDASQEQLKQKTNPQGFFSDINTVHCYNPFSQPNNHGFAFQQPQSNTRVYPDMSQISSSFPLKHTFTKPNGNCSETGTRGYPLSSQTITNSVPSPNLPFAPDKPNSTAYFEQPHGKASASVNVAGGCSTPCDAMREQTPVPYGERAAYSPDVVQVLLNQVGGDRLKGLKQHIMTSIAPKCCPEEFQAAADLLSKYSRTCGAMVNKNLSSTMRRSSKHKDNNKSGTDFSDALEMSSSSGLVPDGPQIMWSSQTSASQYPYDSLTLDTGDRIMENSFRKTDTSTDLSKQFFLPQDRGCEQPSGTLHPNGVTREAFVFSGSLSSPGPTYNIKLLDKSGFLSTASACNDIKPLPATTSNLDSTKQFTDFAKSGHLSPWAEIPNDLSHLAYQEKEKSALPGKNDSHLLDLETEDLLPGKCGNDFFQDEDSQNLLRSMDKASVGSAAHSSDNDTSSLHGVTTDGVSLSDLAFTLESAFHIHMAIFKEMYVGMDKIVREGAEMPVHPLNAETKMIVYKQLIASIANINKAIIGFCNCVPGISVLPKADKDYLTKRAYYDIWMLTNSRLFHEGKTYMRLPDGTIYSREWMETILNKQMVQVFFKFAVAFNILDLSDLELAILCAIQLTSPGNESPGVPAISSSSRGQVEHINSQLVDLLVQEVGRNHVTSGPRILVDIFRLLPDLAEINSLQQNIIANFSTHSCP
ncbi:nuclear hormone receptor e75, partial [Plakobranchus ocellatus]